jgi:hypothetical protein
MPLQICKLDNRQSFGIYGGRNLKLKPIAKSAYKKVRFMKQFLLACFLIAVPVAGFSAFQVYFNTTPAIAGQLPLGDLSAMQTVIKDTAAIAEKGDLAAAEKRITDYETLWDEAEPTLRPMNKEAWSTIDEASDHALKALRAKAPDAAKVKETLATLGGALADPAKPLN